MGLNTMEESMDSKSRTKYEKYNGKQLCDI